MMTAERIEVDEYMDLVAQIAAIVHGKYPDHTTNDDLKQEAYVWWYGKGQKYLADYLTDEHLTRLRRSLWRYMDEYARAEKAQSVGYLPRDQYPYHPREILDLLPMALDPDGLPLVGHHEEGPSAKGNLAEGGDMLASLVDVRRALVSLTEDDLHFLTLVDDCQYDWDRVTARLADGVLADSLRRRHARIAERMARWLSNQEDFQ